MLRNLGGTSIVYTVALDRDPIPSLIADFGRISGVGKRLVPAFLALAIAG